MLVNLKCPNCGATMDDGRDYLFCPSCGGKIINVAEKVDITHNVNVSGKVVHVQDRTNDPNLYISFNSSNPGVGMVSRIVTTGVKNNYVNGQTLSFHLNQGQHRIIIKIGKKNYARDIIIPNDNSPVRIYASYNGRAQITVDQPNVYATQLNAAVPEQSYPNQSVVTQIRSPRKSPLSITAFILSLTMYLSAIGVILGIVDAFVLDKKKENNHVFSYIAMGIGALFTLALIYGLVNGGGNSALSKYANPGISSEADTSVWAAEPTAIDNFKYYIDGDIVYLTEYKGRDKKVWIGSEYEIDGKTYKTGESLEIRFSRNTITSVIIPEGITSIDYYIFYSSGVKYIYIPESLEPASGYLSFHHNLRDVEKIYYGGTREEWKILTDNADRKSIDALEITYDAKINELTGK